MLKVIISKFSELFGKRKKQKESLARLANLLKEIRSHNSKNEEKLFNLKAELITSPSHISNPVTSEYQINFEKRLIDRIKNALDKYPFIKKEKISFLADELIKNRLKHSKNILSLEEKRALNLNTRAKYAKELIECFINVEQFDFDPKWFCDNLLYTERSILWSLDEIEKLKQQKFVTKVSLEGKGKWDNKIYDINNIPIMEKVNYTEERVLFFVIPKVDFDEQLDKQ